MIGHPVHVNGRTQERQETSVVVVVAQFVRFVHVCIIIIICLILLTHVCYQRVMVNPWFSVLHITHFTYHFS